MDVISISSDSCPSSPVNTLLDEDCQHESNNAKPRYLNEHNVSDISQCNIGYFDQDIGNSSVRQSSTNQMNVHALSDSDESDKDIIAMSDLPNAPMEGSSDSDELPTVPKCDTVHRIQETAVNCLKPIEQSNNPKAYKKRNCGNVATKQDKDQRQIEKLQRQAEREQMKALKQATARAQRAVKQGECMKYMQVLLDENLITEEYGGELLVALQTAEVQYAIQSQVFPHTVTWTRNVQEHGFDAEMKLQVVSRLKEEHQVLVIRPWNQLLGLIHTHELCDHIQSIQTVHKGKKVTLVPYKLQKYFREQKNQKRREMLKKVRGGASTVLHSSEHGEVSRQDIELALGALQLRGCYHHFADTPAELGALVTHFTKAIAETPFRCEREKKEEALEWFGVGDSQDCVKVDKNGYGLLRLWQQQLCQFDLAGLETAEAIMSVYPSPQALIQAYDTCTTQKEAAALLQDIPIRRGAGPLSSVRRIGPELSRTIHAFYSATDGEITLSQDG